MSESNHEFRKPSLSQVVLFGIAILACSVDYTRRFSIAGVSGLGALTLATGGAVWAVWLMRPVLPAGLGRILLPLILFEVDGVGTLLWYHPVMDGIQLLVVTLTFLALIMLTARESAADPGLATRLGTTLSVTCLIPTTIWLYLLYYNLVPPPDNNLTRAFSLYAMVVAGVCLANWRASARSNAAPGAERVPMLRHIAPLGLVAFIGLVVAMGLSRTALIIIALLVPLSLIYRGSRRDVWRGILLLAFQAGAFGLLLYSYKPLQDRFFTEDASIKVGNVAFNSSGRTQIWALLLEDLKGDWIVGKGVSSSEDLIVKYLPMAGQPHNDFLRFYYDQGAVGLSLWLLFLFVFTRHTIGNLRRSIRHHTPDFPQHMAALLALTAVSGSMLTDNSYCYSFVMLPLAIVMGSSLGIGHYYAAMESAACEPVEPAFFQPLLHGGRS
jgi:hypothetical protein